MLRTGVPRHIHAIGPTWQVHIRQQQIKAIVPLQFLHSFLAVGGFHYLKIRIKQNLSQKLSDERFILDQQDMSSRQNQQIPFVHCRDRPPGDPKAQADNAEQPVAFGSHWNQG